VTEAHLIEACKRQESEAQKLLYDRYAPTMFGVCKRYIRNRQDAEDVLIEGFFKVLTKIDMYSGSGSFEGWIRRIVVNEALMFLRKRNNFHLSIEADDVDVPREPTTVEELAAQDILDLLDDLPTGYRTVFNLYVLEGLKHREIAEELGISINTSKSQLILARRRMQELLAQKAYPGIEGRGKN